MRTITEPDRAAICHAYQAGEGSTNIGKRYGLSKFRVWGVLRAAKVPIRSKAEGHYRLSAREDVFDTVTEESAYWAGFLMADGCISEKKAEGWQSQIILELEDTDRAHVAAFKSFLHSEHKLVDIRRPASSGASERSCRLAVVSGRLAAALLRYGVTPRKTATAEASDLIVGNRHFWRGVVDGDGHIQKDTYRAAVSLLGSSRLCEQFEYFCSRNIPEFSAAFLPRRGCMRVSCSGKDAWAVLKLLYEDASIALWRKHAVAMQVVARHHGKKWRKRKTPG